MAPRSYLSRIAQPLVAGDPVVWSVPRAAAEEARPPAATSSATPTIRRSPAPKPTAAPAAKPAPSDAIAPEARATPHAPSEPRAQLAPSGLAGQAAAPAPTRAHSPTPMDTLSPAEMASPDAVSTASVTQPTAAEPAAGPRSEHRSFAIADDVTAAPLAAETPSAPSSPTKPSPRHDAAPEPQWPTREEAAPAPHAEPTAIARTPEPRLHIGAIEIRASAPAPVPAPASAPMMMAAAPSPAPGRIGRAYAWRFGLVQG